MSYVRGGRSQQLTKGRRPVVRPKRTAAPRGEWVSTVNDLSVHKLTPAELNYRHEIHKSRNKAAAQWELREKALRSRLGHGGSPAPLDQASLSIIREVFSDQLLLQDVLARSDRAMAVVKDLFGESPRMRTGHPRTTMAPACDSDTELLVLQRPNAPPHLPLPRQSLMDQQALNELGCSEEDHSDDDMSAGSRHRVNVRKTKVKPGGRLTPPQEVLRYVSDHRDTSPVTPFTSRRPPDPAALNATAAVVRVRSRQSQSEEPSALVSQVLNPEPSVNQPGRGSRIRKCVSKNSELDGSPVAGLRGDQSTLGLLRSMLGQVEADLDALSPETEPASSQSPEQHGTQGLTGFSVALVSTLGRLVRIVQQREQESKSEAQERGRLEEMLREQHGLIDALTAETMTLREEVTSLQAQLQRQTAEMQHKFDTVVVAMGGVGPLRTNTRLTEQFKATDYQAAPVAEQPPTSVSPSVLLSRPRPGDNWQQTRETHPGPLDQEPPPFDVGPSHSAPSSAFSVASLPDTSSSSSNAILAKITELSRQNELILTQLGQAKGGRSNGGVEQTRLSCSSTERSAAQSVEERRSPERRTQHIQPEAEEVTHQRTSPSALSGSSMQQHFLVLNSKHAAARSRLLELIEQQKQSVLAKLSPSASPTPSSCLQPPHDRQTGSDVSCLSFGGEIRDGKTQVDKRTEQGGWFALSGHVR